MKRDLLKNKKKNVRTATLLIKFRRREIRRKAADGAPRVSDAHSFPADGKVIENRRARG